MFSNSSVSKSDETTSEIIMSPDDVNDDVSVPCPSNCNESSTSDSTSFTLDTTLLNKQSVVGFEMETDQALNKTGERSVTIG